MSLFNICSQWSILSLRLNQTKNIVNKHLAKHMFKDPDRRHNKRPRVVSSWLNKYIDMQVQKCNYYAYIHYSCIQQGRYMWWLSMRVAEHLPCAAPRRVTHRCFLQADLQWIYYRELDFQKSVYTDGCHGPWKNKVSSSELVVSAWDVRHGLPANQPGAASSRSIQPSSQPATWHPTRQMPSQELEQSQRCEHPLA